MIGELYDAVVHDWDDCPCEECRLDRESGLEYIGNYDEEDETTGGRGTVLDSPAARTHQQKNEGG